MSGDEKSTVVAVSASKGGGSFIAGEVLCAVLDYVEANLPIVSRPLTIDASQAKTSGWISGFAERDRFQHA